MPELNGNIVVAQSGGPTAVINASLAGVIHEAGRHPEIESIYGALNGIRGVLDEEMVDLTEEKNTTIEGLKTCPAAALGTVRYKIKPDDYARALEVFQAHNVRYFFYAGGNDSMDTADKIAKLAVERNFELRVIGIAKTIDNDLAITDHCPGYGSVVKYNATALIELARDAEAMSNGDLVSILEVMGRHSGWIAAGAALAKKSEFDPPHIILLPEVVFNPDKFLADCRAALSRYRYCVVVVGEGLVDAEGRQIAADDKVDAFGHKQLGGIGDYLRKWIEEKTKFKARAAKLGIVQRAATHLMSRTDRDEAYEVGQAAVRAAIAGETGKMVTLVRESNSPYQCRTGLAPLADIANGEKLLPKDWIAENGISMKQEFLDYARPLIQGEVPIPFEDGLPKYVRLEKIPVDKKCAPRSDAKVSAATA